MTSGRKDIRRLIKLAEKQGWVVSKTGGDHLKWVSPTGKLVFCSSTPSDVRAMKNHTSMLRKHGFNPMER